MRIYYWPDGTWCTENELEEMTHKSDDYGTFTSFATSEEVDAQVQAMVNADWGHAQ